MRAEHVPVALVDLRQDSPYGLRILRKEGRAQGRGRGREGIGKKAGTSFRESASLQETFRLGGTCREKCVRPFFGGALSSGLVDPTNGKTQTRGKATLPGRGEFGVHAL